MKRIGVDAHCHIFNATDLPTGDFAAKVVLNIEESLPFGLRHLAEALTKLAVKLISMGAPSGKEELETLGGASLLEMHSLVVLTEREAQGTLMQDIQTEVNLLLESNSQDDRELGVLLQEAWVEPHSTNLADAENLLRNANLLSEPFLPLSRVTPLGLFKTLKYLREFLKYLRYHRYSNARTMFELYGGLGKVNLIAPALVDYEFWLRKAKSSSDPMDTPTPMRRPATANPSEIDQVTVMKKVIEASGGAIHPYVAYDPLRDVEQKGRSLKTAQDAIRDFGFVGVKVYPPMGFQAWGNDGLDFYLPDGSGKKWRTTLGAELDARLRAFFEWCLSEDVPILTHSSSSVLSRNEYYDRPNPKHWGVLLEKSGIPGIENLRVLMGHFAGFGDEPPGSGNAEEKSAGNLIKEWTAEIVRLCLKFPNIYADLSYHEKILDGEDREQYALKLKALLAGAGAGMKRKLCYGSDWVMLAKQPDNEVYRDRMESILTDNIRLSPEEIADILGHNALRFLGLTQNGTGRARLNSFYGLNKVPVPVWAHEANALI